MDKDKPDFSAQTSEHQGRDDRDDWLRARADEMREQGATWFRAMHSTTHPDLLLIEGWRVQPETEPEPHFHMTAGES